MAVKGKSPQPLPVDSALSAHMGPAEDDPIYGRMEQVSRARKMTQSQRKKAEKDAARNRVMFDIPKALEQVVDMLAADQSVTRSQVAAYLMLAGLAGLEDGTVEPIENCRQVSRSMRYEYILALPDVPVGFKKRLAGGK